MDSKTLYIAQLHKDIELLPEDKLPEVQDFIEFLLHRSARHKRRIVKMQGIWAGKGFEKLTSLEDDLRAIRAEVEDAIVHKAI